jgi:hypothetical protein
MGFVGRKIGQFVGKQIGKFAGDRLGETTGIGKKEGGKFGKEIGGNVLGQLIPFKRGGKVRKTGPALIHKGEFVLPSGVKPTSKQMKAVLKRKRKSRR